MRGIVLWPVAAAALACSGSTSAPASTTTTPAALVEVSTVRDPISVSAVAQPIAVSSVAEPVAVSAVAQPVAVSGIASPVTVGPVTLAGPVTLGGPIVMARPELDPDRIESGDQQNGKPASCRITFSPCTMLAAGPFILTDAILTHGDVTLFATADPTSAPPRWTLTLTDNVRAGYASLQTSGTISTPTGTNYVTLSTSEPSSTTAITGARLAVRTGENLYLYVNGVGATFTWSGFRP